MNTIRSIKGLVAFITGGASGLGKATAQRLVQQGASVVLCDLPSSKGDSVAQELGENCIFAPGDVTSEEDMKNAIRATNAKFQKLDVTINCAGVNILPEKGLQLPVKDYMKVLEVKLCGTFNVTRLAACLMAKNQPDDDGQRGIIINTSGISAFDGQPDQVALSTSEGAIAGLTLPLARDLEYKGIRCCTIALGLFDTPFLNTLSEEDRAILTKEVPFPKRLGKPEEFACFIQKVIENPMLNGCIIRLDGALRM